MNYSRKIRRFIGVFVAGAPILALAGCNTIDLTSACGPRRRVVDASSIQHQNGTLFLLVHFEVQELVTGADRSIGWLIEGSPLKGRLTDISLRDGRDTSRLLMTVPISSDTTVILLATGATFVPTGNVPFASFFDLLSGGNGLALFHTNTASSTIQVPLSDVFVDTLDACTT